MKRRLQGLGPGERKVWAALAIIAWLLFLIYAITWLDPTVTCSNTSPC